MADPTPSSLRIDAIAASLVFLAIAPGTVAGIFPWVITRWQFRDYAGSALGWPIGALLIAAGAAVLLEAFLRFALNGLGSPAPVYPTKRLIVTGSYRFVRNPMYLAVEAVILGQALLFGAFDLVIYGAMIGVAFYLFVMLVEEPNLKRMFPKAYRRYRENVPRWLPRLTPWRPTR